MSTGPGNPNLPTSITGWAIWIVGVLAVIAVIAIMVGVSGVVVPYWIYQIGWVLVALFLIVGALFLIRKISGA